jgi:hypothetical protein
MEGLGRRIWSQAGSGKKLKSLSEKLTKAKSDGGVAQVVEHLPCKCKGLNSNCHKEKKIMQKNDFKETSRDTREF